jgi:hypothetical protein
VLELSPRTDRIAPRLIEEATKEIACFSIHCWPTCDYPIEDDYETTVNEHVELVAFSADAYQSKISLDDLLRRGFSGFNQTGDENEIAALERLKATCDELIAVRRERIKQFDAIGTDIEPSGDAS